MNKENEKLILISIMSYYARQIFNGTKKFEFRKSPLKPYDLNKPIFVYSAKEDKAIIGSFEVVKVHKGNLNEILKITGYDKRSDRQEIIDYYKNCENCYALELSNITQFSKPLTLKQMRKIDNNIQLPQYYSCLTQKSPLYKEIKSLHSYTFEK